MGVIKRQGVKTSFVAYFGVILGAVNTLWLYPRFLEKSEIGLIALLTNVSLIIAPLAQLGVNGIILKYYPYVKGDEKKSGSFLYFILLIPTIGFILAMASLFICRRLVIESFAENSSLFVDYLFALVPFSFILVGRNIADTFSRAQLRIAMPKFFKEVALRLLIFILVIYYSIQSLSLDILVFGYISTFGVNLLLMLLYLRKLKKIKIKFTLSHLEKPLIRESLIYGLFIILSGFTGMIVTKIDSWMISSMLDLGNTGVYTIALYIGLAIEMPKRSLNLISLPIIGKSMKEGKIDEVAKLYSKSALIQLIIGSLLFICVWVNIDELFALIPNSKDFVIGKYVVLFISLAVLFDMSTGVNNEILLMSDYYKWNIVIMLFLIIIAIINNYLLIPIYGITGAAIATAISILLFNIVKFVLIYIKLKIQPFGKKNVISLTISIIVFVIGLSLPVLGNPYIDILYRTGIILLIYIPIHYKLKTSPDLNNMAKQILQKLHIKL